MLDDKLLKNLQSHLNQINNMIAVSKLGLLKSEDLSHTKNMIEDALKSYRPFLEQIQALKIDKIIEPFRTLPKTGIFLDSHITNQKLIPLRNLVQELILEEGGSEAVDPVNIPELVITSTTVNQAIRDAKTLLKNEGAVSAVDRMHTVLHGYLKQVCRDADIEYNTEDTINQLLNKLKLKHPDLVIKNDNADKILKNLANVLDKVNPLRNNSTLAHANDVLLEEDEAMFVINTINTVLSFLNSKFSK